MVMKMATAQLDDIFTALADPTRRAILARLVDGDANVSDLAAPFAMSQPAVSKHLKILERAGLISRRTIATSRLSHLEAEPLREATMWMENYRQLWDEGFDKLDAALARFASAQENSTTATNSHSTDQKGTGQ